jgi:hypothetical protein
MIFHWHKWKAIAVSTPWGDATTVLYRCRECGEPKTVSFTGHWTLSQITGEEE